MFVEFVDVEVIVVVGVVVGFKVVDVSVEIEFVVTVLDVAIVVGGAEMLHKIYFCFLVIILTLLNFVISSNQFKYL